MNLTATITIKGDPGLLREYRAHVNRLLDEEGGDSYRELHTGERLEYQFTLRGGIPFPPFIAASQAFPELTVEVGWNAAGEGRSGRAVIQNGILREQAAQTHSPAGAALRDARADADGRLRFAVICTRWREFWHGYAIASDQHAFFRIAGSSSAGELFASDGIEAQWAERWTVSAGDADYSELAPREPIAEDELRELDRLAQEFSREWIWFEESPLEETAVERARFADYGYPVRAANLRSEKLRKVLRPESGGLAFGSFGEDTRWIPELLRRCWLRPAK
ncbi:MAG: hypothetical protein E6H49_14580 [Betaproteobacteria bacterium]|nr:MAG: hypothetical protein E6H49_14580 [Betaproteobacteria bacterium]